jgi:nucleoside-diphosphate-sugar epimerase
MDTSRAREELGWEPRRSSVEAIREVLSGIAGADGEPTPPLETSRR